MIETDLWRQPQAAIRTLASQPSLRAGVLPVAQVVCGNTEGNGDVERRFDTAHRDMRNAVAKGQELGINAGKLVTYDEDEQSLFRVRRDTKEILGLGPALQGPQNGALFSQLLGGLEGVGIARPGYGLLRAKGRFSYTRVMRRRRHTAEVQMAKSGTISGAEHGPDVEYAAYIV